ncbi:MAG: hypothetical protein IJU25_03680, partial [Lachnospiraceae bacterium]|nr:hypothetical protein [Lachnospiraceae bacterium]
MRKKSISKRILALALAATLFAGCGMQGTTTTNDASEPSAVKGTVTEPAAKKKGSYDIEEKQIPV